MGSGTEVTVEVKNRGCSGLGRRVGLGVRVCVGCTVKGAASGWRGCEPNLQPPQSEEIDKVGKASLRLDDKIGIGIQ